MLLLPSNIINKNMITYLYKEYKDTSGNQIFVPFVRN